MFTKNLHRRPIGVFDSGIGGLTVAKSLFELLPNENIIYLGDTARLPYGSKSKETVILYSIECLKFLLSKNVKMIVVACNTASSVAVPFLLKVIGTLGTIKSKSYNKQIKKFDIKPEIYSQSCSLFVQLAEDGWTDNTIAYLTAKEYLQKLKNSGIDTLILGCTHYPILKKTIRKAIGKNIKLIDSGEETAKEVKIFLEKNSLLNKQKKTGVHKFFVTDFPNNFKTISERFLGIKMKDVKKIKL